MLGIPFSAIFSILWSWRSILIPLVLAGALFGTWELYKYEKNKATVLATAAQMNYDATIALQNQFKLTDEAVTASIKAAQDRAKKYDLARKDIALAPPSEDGPVPAIVNRALDQIRAMEATK